MDRLTAPLPLVGLLAAVVLAGCATLEPVLPEAEPGIAENWSGTATTVSSPATAEHIGWRHFFGDPQLKELIAQALANNRDLRVAMLNVERARALYRIERSAQLPSVNANGGMTWAGGENRSTAETYSAELGITQFELDLFGRVRQLSEAALQHYFATEEARRGAQLSLVAEVAHAYLTLIADQELERIAQATVVNYQAVFDLTERRHELGAASALELSQARTILLSAHADAARFAGRVAQDINALSLLVGAPIDTALLPVSFEPGGSGIAVLPVGLPSDVLLRRPDVAEAERRLRAANASIGAARAAYFPSITLTGAVGSASSDLSDLLGNGSGAWRFIPQINLPIFQAGRLRANHDVAIADRDIALARYERSIQAGFRETADVLTLNRALAEQRQFLETMVAAAVETEQLSEKRYRAGQDSYLVLLDAQRTLYEARQALINTQIAEQANRVNLYKVLGGGWQEHS